MLIESAFFKLLHIWTAQERIKLYKLAKLFESHGRTFYEAQAASEFANLIMNELLSVGIHIPERFVIQNSSYPDNSHKRVDIKINFSEYFKASKMLSSYISRNNFIEVKLYGSIDSTIGGETKTENIGSILNDILRLELFTRSLAGGSRERAKYMLVYFDDHPKKYVAYNKKGGGRREWIEKLLVSLSSSGDISKQSKGEIPNISKMPVVNFSGNLEINLNNTKDVPNSMFNKIVNGLGKKINRNSTLKIPFVKYMVFPFSGNHQAYFFLIRIFNVKIIKGSTHK